VSEQERSLAVFTRLHPSHAVRKTQSVRAVAFVGIGRIFSTWVNSVFIQW